MNYQLFHLINAMAGRWTVLDTVMRLSAADLIFVVFAIGGVIVVHALTRRRIRPVAALGATLVVAFGLGQLLAHTSRERRPFQDHAVHQLIAHDPGISMPSDHATAAFAVAFGVLVFLNRRAGYALTSAAILIGFARVWAGLHYPGDILAAAVIAALATLVVHVIRLGPPRHEGIGDLNDPAVPALPAHGSSSAERRPSSAERRPSSTERRPSSAERRPGAIPRPAWAGDDQGRRPPE